jgi:chemotaxis protein MotB
MNFLFNHIFLNKFVLIQFFIFLYLNPLNSESKVEDEANDWFYYRSEYRELLKKKKQSEKEFQDSKEQFLQESAAIKRENEVLRARLVALEVELYNTKESKAAFSQITERRLSEINEKMDELESSKERYESSLQELKEEKAELTRKLDENSRKSEERIAALEMIEQLEREKKALEDKYIALNSEYEALKINLASKKVDRVTNPSDYDNLILSTNLERMLTPQEVKALREENVNLQAEVKRLTADLELVQKSEKDFLSKKLEEQAEQLQSEYNRKLNQFTIQLARLREREQELTLENSKLKEQLERASSLTKKDLEDKLKDEIGNGDMNITQDKGRVIINVYDRITFDLGNGELKKSGNKTLNKIISVLNQYKDRKIYIEGNTDNLPIRGGKYKDNWELSTYRALSVLRYILTRTSIPEKNFAAVGNGEFNPIKSNFSEQNRGMNRRVDIVLLPNLKNVTMGN